jgi:hypothetical protein
VNLTANIVSQADAGMKNHSGDFFSASQVETAKP